MPVRALYATLLAGALAACGVGSGSTGSDRPVLRLGFFPNLTHAPALAGVDKGFFAQALAGKAELRTTTFNAGPETVQALLSGALDLAYIGPNPAINAYAQSKGVAVRIIAGAVSGGAALIVKPGIGSAADLRGKRLASPQLGNTQDVALRAWLKEHGLAAVTGGTGDVTISPQANAQTLETFRAGQIDGAWVPEPWATRLVQEAGGKVLVDERTLWPGGRFVTTHVIARTEFLRQHRDLVEAFLRGHLAAIDFLNANAPDAQTVVNAALKRLTGKALGDELVSTAWKNLTFTADPIASSLRASAEHARSVGLLKPVDLSGIYELDLLNGLLTSDGKPAVAA